MFITPCPQISGDTVDIKAAGSRQEIGHLVYRKLICQEYDINIVTLICQEYDINIVTLICPQVRSGESG